jgi:hypothetical protein
MGKRSPKEARDQNDAKADSGWAVLGKKGHIYENLRCAFLKS